MRSSRRKRAMGEVIRAATTRSERLVDGLLALAESERGLAQTETADLAELVRSAVSQVAAVVQQAGIGLTTALTPAPVTGARVLLEQLIETSQTTASATTAPAGGSPSAQPGTPAPSNLPPRAAARASPPMKQPRSSNRSGRYAPTEWARHTGAALACPSSAPLPAPTAATQRLRQWTEAACGSPCCSPSHHPPAARRQGGRIWTLLLQVGMA